jgi:dipeptidyl aminopeptidase/acylaminoacyl peptidase
MRNLITSANVAVAMGSLLLVVAWHLIAVRDKPRLEKIAAELVATREFFYAPSPNHAGTKLLYAETTENGVSGYFVDVDSGDRKSLFDADQTHLLAKPFLGWSPDDALFAFVNSAPGEKISICDGKSGAALATLPSKSVAEGVWLSDEAFVYRNNSQDLTLIRKSGDKWSASALIAKKPANQPTNAIAASPANGRGTTVRRAPVVTATNAIATNRGRTATQRTPAVPATNTIAANGTRTAVRRAPTAPVQNLVAISKTSVAWQQGNALWKYDLGSDAPAKIWESTTNTLLNFCFSGERNAFTLHCASAAGEFVFDLYPAFIWRDERITSFEPIQPPEGAIIHSNTLKFIRGGLGYAYLARSPTFDATVIKPDSNSVPIQLTWSAGVDMDSLAANDNHVYATGSPTNGPLNIWDYDVKAGSLSTVVSGREQPFKYAGIATSANEETTNADGETVVYHLWPPVNFVAGRKYPLVISFNGVRWRPQEGCVPDAGCFLASLNDIPSNYGDVVAVYQAAIQHPGIDAHRVYIMGASGGANLSGYFLQERPELWRGAVLLSPVGFPDPSQLKAARILIDSGSGDQYLKQAGGIPLLTKFQDSAAAAGIPVTLSINPRASHVYRSKIAQEERVQQIMEFLSGE